MAEGPQRSVYVSGTLNFKSELRSYPKLNRVNSQARDLQPTKQSIPILFEQGVTQEVKAFNLIQAYYVSRFYREARLAASLAGIIANCSDRGNMRPWQHVINAYKAGGIALEFEELTAGKLAGLRDSDEHFKEFLNKWERDAGYAVKKTYAFFILSLVLLLSMFKNLNEINYENWIANRIKTFAGTLGDTWTVENVTPATFPLMAQVMNLSKIISACHPVRRALYIEILSIANQKNNVISNAFAEVNHLIRSHEIQHLILIDKYILEEHPEFLSTVVLRGLRQ